MTYIAGQATKLTHTRPQSLIYTNHMVAFMFLTIAIEFELIVYNALGCKWNLMKSMVKISSHAHTQK